MERGEESAAMKIKGTKRLTKVKCEARSGSSSSSSSSSSIVMNKKKKCKRDSGYKYKLDVEKYHDYLNNDGPIPSYLSYYHGGTYRKSPETMRTLQNIETRRQRRSPTAGSVRTIHDNTSRGYGWLLPGWLGEERLMEHGRVYRYYYDPSGSLYKSQEEVVSTWERAGLIVLDK